MAIPEEELSAESQEDSNDFSSESASDSAEPEYKIPGAWGDARDVWDSLPENAKKKVLAREQSMHNGLSMYKDGHTKWQSITDRLKDHLPMLRARGVEMESAIPQLMSAASILHNGTAQQKRALINSWVQHFGVDLTEEAEQEYADPRVQQIESRLSQLDGQLNQFSQQEMNRRLTESREQVRVFTSDPKNKYFERVSGKIADLIRSGVTRDLKEAYDMAIWADSEVRSELLAEQQGSGRAAAVSAIKAAGTNMRGQPKPASLSHKPGMTLREQVTAAAEQLGLK